MPQFQLCIQNIFESIWERNLDITKTIAPGFKIFKKKICVVNSLTFYQLFLGIPVSQVIATNYFMLMINVLKEEF